MYYKLKSKIDKNNLIGQYTEYKLTILVEYALKYNIFY